jgi:hypothetical protein
MVCTINIEKHKKFDKIYPIRNTNDYIALTNTSEIVYIEHDVTNNTIDTFINNGVITSKTELVKNILAVYNSNKQLLVFNLQEVKLKHSFQTPFLELNVTSLKYFSISPDCHYLSLFEQPKFLSLYRLIDCSKCASILLYSEIDAMIITEKFVSLAMTNRRILSYLIVDPLEENHEKRVEELPSRYILITSFFYF